MSCPLCDRLRRTAFYYEDSKFWIVDCLTCGVPLVVLKEHKPTATPEEEEEMKELIKRVMVVDWYYIDNKNRQIKDHKHWHLRRK